MSPVATGPDSDPVPSERSPRDSGGALHHYRAFGHCLASEIEIPELEPVDPQPAHWTFELMAAGKASSGGRLLGEEALYADVSARLYRHGDGYRIEVDDTGVYDLSPDGARIRWLPNAEPWWDFGRGHLLGRVLSTAMHFAGLLVLHGSAVEVEGGVIAFLGVKGAGKSTLALALVREGARLVTDDTLPIDVEAGCAVWPGIHSLRLRPDTADADLLSSELTTAGGDGTTLGRDGKLTTAPLDRSRVMTTPGPLRAVYLLQPGRSRDAERVLERSDLDAVRATAALTGFSKIAAMLGADEAGTLLDRAAAVAQSVPVHLLLVHRATDRLADVAREIVAWHGPTEASRG